MDAIRELNRFASDGQGMPEPKISVILPVQNSGKYIDQAIHSVLNQTMADFELIVLDDASTDDTVPRIRAYNDPRIRVIELDGVTTGLPDVLNYGVELARGKYLARMDGDDICVPDRFQQQSDFLDKHPDIGFCGSFAYVLGTDTVRTCPTEHEDIRASLLFYNDLVHPAVMMRRGVFLEHHLEYPTGYLYAEDYALWATMIERVRFHILPQPLLHYRVHQEQVSTHHRRTQFASGTRLQGEMLTRLGVGYTAEELQIHTDCKALAGDERLRAWCEKVWMRNQEVQFYAPDALKRIIDPFM